MSNRDIFRIGYTVSSLLLSGQLALACDCARLTFEERIALSKVIFVGRVVEFEPIEKVSMVVEEVLKGDIEGIVTIPTGVSNCDYFLPPLEPNLGERYLIFASYEDKLLDANRCLESGPVSDKSDEILKLRELPISR